MWIDFFCFPLSNYLLESGSRARICYSPLLEFCFGQSQNRSLLFLVVAQRLNLLKVERLCFVLDKGHETRFAQLELLRPD